MTTANATTAGLDAAKAGQLTLGGELTVNRLGFGAMRLTGPGIIGEPPDIEEAGRVLRRAVELGVTFIDTADSYGPAVSEQLIARALHPYPKGLVIATKGGLIRPGPDVWERDARPEHLRAACESSLQRLRLDCIDVYQLHAPDPRVPFEDSVGELVRLREEGKIRHIGLSNVGLEELQRAQKLTPIVSVQNRYNLEDRRHEDVLAACARQGIAFIPWAPLGSGRHATASGSSDTRRAHELLAESKGVTAGQLAIAWLLARSAVMLPIPGTSSVAHLEENIAAASIRLTQDELRRLG